MSIKSSNIKRIGVMAICLLSFIFSCKKKQPHELTGDKAIFVGTWYWVYSTHTYDYCDGSGTITTDTLDPETENHEFKIIFKEEGEVTYYQDGTLIEQYYIFFKEFGETVICSSINSKRFSIAYSYEGEGILNGCINQDTLRAIPFEDFLFPYTPGCEGYQNYFVKE